MINFSKPIMSKATKTKLEKYGKVALNVLKACNDVALKCPKASDSLYEKVIKVAGMAESAYRLVIAESKQTYKTPSKYLKQQYDANIINSRFLTNLITSSNVFDDFESKTEVVEGIETVFQHIIFPDGERVIFCQQDSRESVGLVYLHYFYATPNFDFPKLFDKLWLKNNNSLAVEYVSDGMYNKQMKLISADQNLYFMTSAATAKVDELNDFNIGNVMLISGPAGVGKTSAPYLYAQKENKRILKFTGSTFENGDISEICSLITFMHPDIVLIDDADRTTLAHANSDALYLLEVFHQQLAHVMFILTANYPQNIEKALLRTGRIDYVMEYDLPNEAEREEIIRHFVTDLTALPDMITFSNNLPHSDVVGFAKRVEKHGLEKATKAMQRLAEYRANGKAYEED